MDSLAIDHTKHAKQVSGSDREVRSHVFSCTIINQSAAICFGTAYRVRAKFVATRSVILTHLDDEPKSFNYLGQGLLRSGTITLEYAIFEGRNDIETSIKEMVEIQRDDPTQEIFTLNASLQTHLS